MYEANVYFFKNDQSVCYWTVADSIRQIINTVLKHGHVPYYLTIVDADNEQVPPHHVGYLLKLLDRKINR